MKYAQIEPISREEAATALASGDPSFACEALVRLAFFDEDCTFVEATCMQYTRHPNAEIRKAATICFGHLARIHGHLDLDRVLPLLEALSADPLTVAQASAAMDDVRMFILERGPTKEMTGHSFEPYVKFVADFLSGDMAVGDFARALVGFFDDDATTWQGPADQLLRRLASDADEYLEADVGQLVSAEDRLRRTAMASLDELRALAAIPKFTYR